MYVYENGSEADFFLHNVPGNWLIAWSAISWMLVAIAALLNGFNLFVLLLHCCRFRFSPARNLLLILFVHDLLLSAFFYPAIIDNLVNGNRGLWNNVVLCQVFSFCNIFCSMHTTFMGAQIALYRAFMSSQSFTCNRVLERKQKAAVRITTGTTTVVGLVTASIPFMVPEEMEIKPPYGFCGPHSHQYGKGIQIAKMVLWVFVPCLITFTSYVKIYVELKRRRNAFQESSSSSQDGGRLMANFSTRQPSREDATVVVNTSAVTQRYDRAASRLKLLSRKMLAMLMTKLTAHMPIALFYIHTTRENRDPILNLVVLFLNFASTLFHPIVYGMINSHMREPYRNVIGMFRR